MNYYLAQGLHLNFPSDDGGSTDPINIEGPLKGIEKISDIINIGIKFLFPLAGILLFVFMVWGGYNFLLSGGDPEKIKSGKAKMTSAIIGFILLALSFFLTRLIARIFGLGAGFF